ncbi:MAG: transcription termination/antitermination protein NusA [Deltaproteobacteria bacterium]|nr:MAG: transcription termination/antitermination protein NusA [Deltaproteobacteria bacterium]
MSLELKRIIEQVERDKGIKREILIEALEAATLTAAKKRFGFQRELEAHYNDELGEIEVFEFREVVERIKDLHTEISLEEARDLDPETQLGDSIGVKLEAREFGRISAQTAKQVITQRMKEAEREVIYNDFKERQGEIVQGIVRRFEEGGVVIDLGRTEAIIPPREQIARENYRPGERIRAYVLDIQKSAKGPQIILSRSNPKFIIKLFTMEVPEIYEGIVEIRAAAREPGGRVKIAVYSRNSDVDPVGACVGMKGSRVQSVVQELRGEKIDIIAWSSEPARFVINALAPAEISEVVIDERNKSMEVIVPDDQLSLAIGRKGQNVRLAVQLTGWNIDIKSEAKLKELLEQAHMILGQIPGIGNKTAETLFSEGFQSLEVLANAQIEELNSLPGIGKKTAEKILKAAKEYLSQEIKNEE